MKRIHDAMQVESACVFNDAANPCEAPSEQRGEPQNAAFPNAVDQLLQAGRK